MSNLGTILNKSFEKANMSSSFVGGHVIAREENDSVCNNHYVVRRLDDGSDVSATLDNQIRKSCLDTYTVKIAIGSYVLMYPQETVGL